MTPSELLYQIQRFHSFLWASGGCFSDFYIHIIDHCCWMKNAWPVKAQALGGRHYRKSPEGSRTSTRTSTPTRSNTRSPTAPSSSSTAAAWTAAKVSTPATCTAPRARRSSPRRATSGSPRASTRRRSLKRPDLVWESKLKPEERDPYQNEWNDLIDAIRNDKPYNEVKRGVEASLVTSMGRMAAHTGQEITFDDMLNCKHEFAPGLDKLTAESPAPLKADKDGRYPVPNPGVTKTQEY